MHLAAPHPVPQAAHRLVNTLSRPPSSLASSPACEKAGGSQAPSLGKGRRGGSESSSSGGDLPLPRGADLPPPPAAARRSAEGRSSTRAGARQEQPPGPMAGMRRYNPPFWVSHRFSPAPQGPPHPRPECRNGQDSPPPASGTSPGSRHSRGVGWAGTPGGGTGTRGELGAEGAPPRGWGRGRPGRFPQSSLTHQSKLRASARPEGRHHP